MPISVLHVSEILPTMLIKVSLLYVKKDIGRWKVVWLSTLGINQHEICNFEAKMAESNLVFFASYWTNRKCGKMLTLPLQKMTSLHFSRPLLFTQKVWDWTFGSVKQMTRFATLSPSEENVSRSLAGEMSKAPCHMTKDCEPTIGSFGGDGYLPVVTQGRVAQ